MFVIVQCMNKSNQLKLHFQLFQLIYLLGDSWNYMPPILVSSSAKHTVTQVLVIAKLNRRTNFVLRGFACDIKRLSNELPVQS